MKSSSLRLSLARRLLAVLVSLAVLISTPAFAIASGGASSKQPARQQDQQPDATRPDIQLTSVTATPTALGVLLEWHTNAAPDNVGFNIYRLKNGERTRANKEIIPGVQFKAGPPELTRGGYSFGWVDRKGTADSTYLIESVNADGVSKIQQAVTPSPGIMSRAFQAPQNAAGSSETESTDSFEKQFPAAELHEPEVVNGTLQDQWAIVAQAALKISIKKDGWYRVTQPQMVAAGFNPTVDIRNLRLFVDANEVAINTSQLSGTFSSNDYIEFYGQGLDIPTTDTRIYYLIAGTTPGKRVQGGIQLDGSPPPIPSPSAPPQSPAPSVTPVPAPLPGPAPIAPASEGPVLRDPIFFSWIDRDLRLLAESLQPNSPVTSGGDSDASKTQGENNARNENPAPETARIEDLPLSEVPSLTKQPVSTAVENPTSPANGDRVQAIIGATKATSASATLGAVKPNGGQVAAPMVPAKARKRSTRRKKNRLRKQYLPERHHAMMADGFVPPNYDYTIQIKDRGVYFSSLLNGEAENFFGRVISGPPVTLTLNAPNPDTTAAAPATLDFALQGVTNFFGNSHAITISFNSVTLGSITFGPQDHPVQSYPIPVGLLQSGGVNQLTFTKTTTGENCIVDYARLTYPHTFKADSETAKFTLRGTQTLKVDGFATPLVRLIDYTDPLNVGLSKAVSEPSASGYAITAPANEAAGKTVRLLYAVPFGQFDQPAALSLNQPSSLNLSSNAADYLIVTYKDFVASMEPLRLARSNGMIAETVDVEDVYDEFSYGVHGPQAIKSFLQYASTHWVTPPRYVVFAGDASFDPRNYFNLGNFDFVPTKLIDTQFEETVSDDWLTDFDDDGIADIPVGRLPARTAADANLMVTKIINFTPAPVQNAMLVADDPTGYYFNFESANDQVQSLLPPGTPVQKAYRRLEIQVLSGNITTNSTSGVVTGTGTNFTNPAEVQIGTALTKLDGDRLGIVASIQNSTTLTLTTNATSNYNGAYGRQDDALATAHIYSGHGNVDVWTGSSLFISAYALALTNGNDKLSFVVVMDCLNAYYQDPVVLSLGEAFMEAPGGGAVAVFASSGKTFPDGQHEMSNLLYSLIYSGPPIALGDAIKTAKGATTDIDVRRTWIYFGDPALKIR
jgi:peptidase C25-like protein